MMFLELLTTMMTITKEKMWIWMLRNVMNLMTVCIKHCSNLTFHLISYVEDDDGENFLMPGVGPIAMHASNRDDPLLEIKDEVCKIFCFLKSTANS